MQTDSCILSEDLHQLAKSIIDEVKEAKAAGRIKLQDQEYVLRPDYSLWYAGDPKLMSFEVKNVKEEVWNWSNVQDFIRNHIAIMPEYQKVLGIPEREDLISGFVWRITYDAATLETVDVERHVGVWSMISLERNNRQKLRCGLSESP